MRQIQGDGGVLVHLRRLLERLGLLLPGKTMYIGGSDFNDFLSEQATAFKDITF